MSERALEGIVVGIPAARRARETAALVERWGGTPLLGPAMQEVPVEDDSELQAATQRIASSGVAWSIHLTGVGTRRWFDAARGWDLLADLVEALKRARVVARGAKSAAALRAEALEPVWIPPGETSPEIAKWLAERVDGSDVVALQLHGSPVPHLVETVEGAGGEVIEVAPYRWELPADLGPVERLVSGIVAGEVHAMVVTSAPQVDHLFRVADSMGVNARLQSALGERVFVAAVGVVAAQGVRSHGLEADLVADPPRMGALMRALAKQRDRIVAKQAADLR